MTRTRAAAALLAALLLTGAGYLFLAPSAAAQPKTASAMQQRLDQAEERVAAAQLALTAHQRALTVRTAQATALATDYQRAQAELLSAGARGTRAQADAVAQARSAWQAAHDSANDLVALVAGDRVRLADAVADRAVVRRAVTAERLRGDLARRGLLPSSVRGGKANPRAVRAVEFALAQVGDPYVWAANGPDSWDCSGLTRGAYLSVGVSLPRVSRQQYWAGPLVHRAHLLAGDLVFLAYDPADPATIHHVGLYVGDGLMVHAPQSGDVVKISPVPSHGYAGAVRVLPALAAPPATVTPSATSSRTATPRPTLTPQPSPTSPASPMPTPVPSPVPSPSTSPTPLPLVDLAALLPIVS